MVSDEQHDRDRDAALRSLLVNLVQEPTSRTLHGVDHGVGMSARERVRVGLVTAAVLIVVVLVSAVAFHTTLQIRGADVGGRGGNPSTLPATSPSAPTAPTPTAPAGRLLGRFTSADGAKQQHTIHPDGLAIATSFTCSGKGTYLVSIAHDADFGGGDPKGCQDSDSDSGNKGVPGSTTVTVTAGPHVTWTLTITGIKETYITPQPVDTATSSTGTVSRFCTPADLSVKFESVKASDGVTEVNEGQIAFTNTSVSNCTLAGYPMVRFLDHGVPLGQHTMDAVDSGDQIGKGIDSVDLAPRATAYTQIGWYLPNYYSANKVGRCVSRTISAVQVDLANHLAGPRQTGSIAVPLHKTVTACLNSQWGATGKLGQISSTVFVNYSEPAEPWQ